MKSLAGVLIAGVLVLGFTGISIAKGEDAVIKNGKKVAFEYTLTVDGNVVDSSKGREPIKYTHGSQEIIPGLAKQLEGLKVGDEKNVKVAPEEAYGVPNPQAFKEVPRSSLPQNVEPKVGALLQVKSPEGQLFPVKIAEVKKDTVIIDFNHPLAGKTLNFQVKIVSIE